MVIALIAVGWLLTAFAVAVVLGRGIRLADRKELRVDADSYKAGFEDGYAQGFAVGYDEGRADGIAEGRRLAAQDAKAKEATSP